VRPASTLVSRVAGELAPDPEVSADACLSASDSQEIARATAAKRRYQVGQQSSGKRLAPSVDLGVCLHSHEAYIIAACTVRRGAAARSAKIGLRGATLTMKNFAAPGDTISHVPDQPHARIGLAIVRLTIGAMFVWVFFENRGKGLYTPAGYAGLINYYIKQGHAPAPWKAVMAVAAGHASMAAPLQGLTEISLGVLLVLGLLTRPVGLVACGLLASLWLSEWGTAWIWELLVPTMASLALALGCAGRTWGLDAILARRWPSSVLW